MNPNDLARSVCVYVNVSKVHTLSRASVIGPVLDLRRSSDVKAVISPVAPNEPTTWSVYDVGVAVPMPTPVELMFTDEAKYPFRLNWRIFEVFVP